MDDDNQTFNRKRLNGGNRGGAAAGRIGDGFAAGVMEYGGGNSQSKSIIIPASDYRTVPITKRSATYKKHYAHSESLGPALFSLQRS